MDLKILGWLAKENTTEVGQVTELFKALKVERLDAARSLINDVSSKGKTKQDTAKGKWSDQEYASRRDLHEKKAKAPSTNSYKSPQQQSSSKVASRR